MPPLLALLLGTTVDALSAPDRSEVDQVLDALHALAGNPAATAADAETYFDLFTEDAVFIGTDATERWDLPAFRAFAAPRFATPPAWSYTPSRREVSFDDRGRTAWFDELLRHERYGQVRGSGVLVRRRGQWKVAQYVLSFPIPNEVAGEVVARVRGHLEGAPAPASRLPTPFTAAQIRAVYVPGYFTEHRHTERVEGKDVVTLHRTAVLEADAERVRMRHDQDGVEQGQGEHRWDELRDHASFPAAATTWTDETITVPAGTFETRRYTVTSPEGKVKTLWFSLSHPGPPVRMTIEAGGERVFEMALVAIGP